MPKRSFPVKHAEKRRLHVALVEDEPMQRLLVSGMLEASGFRVSAFADTVALRRDSALQEADLILLYWELPNESGLELLRSIREAGTQTPVIFLTGVEDEVVRIVTKALEKILGEIDDRELVSRVVKSCLSLARQERTVTLRVRPDDVSHVKSRMGELLADHPGISFMQVEGDSRLDRGGCILETEMGVVDASVDVQLEAIRRSLARTVKGK